MKKIEQILSESYHRELTGEEKNILEQALKEDENLKKEKLGLDQTNELLKSYHPVFKKGFADRVMDRMMEQRLKAMDLFPFFKKVFIGGIAAALALLLSVYLSDGSIDPDTLMGLSDLHSEELLFALMNF